MDVKDNDNEHDVRREQYGITSVDIRRTRVEWQDFGLTARRAPCVYCCYLLARSPGKRIKDWVPVRTGVSRKYFCKLSL